MTTLEEPQSETPLHISISAIIGKRFGCHTVADDLRRPPLHSGRAVFLLAHNHRASGSHGWVFIEKVKGSQEEPHRVARRCCVGDVFSVRHMQEAHSYPGHHVLQTSRQHFHTANVSQLYKWHLLGDCVSTARAAGLYFRLALPVPGSGNLVITSIFSLTFRHLIFHI